MKETLQIDNSENKITLRDLFESITRVMKDMDYDIGMFSSYKIREFK